MNSVRSCDNMDVDTFFLVCTGQTSFSRRINKTYRKYCFSLWNSIWTSKRLIMSDHCRSSKFETSGSLQMRCWFGKWGRFLDDLLEIRGVTTVSASCKRYNWW